MATTKAYCLTIEIKDGSTDCGYSICFEAAENFDYTAPVFEKWRRDVTTAVFDAGGNLFSVHRDQLLKKMIGDFEGINAMYPDYQIRNSGAVPALQVQSVDGRKLDVDMTGSFDPLTDITSSRKTWQVSKQVTSHGAGGIGLARKDDFSFIEPVIAHAQAPLPKKKHKGPKGL